MGFFTEIKKKLADKLISYFEYSTTELQYNKAKNIGDNRGYTCGRNGFTTGTGDALEVIECYLANPNKTPKVAQKFDEYITELKRLRDLYNKLFEENGKETLNEDTGNIKNLVGFDIAWKNVAEQDQAFKEAQDEIVKHKQYEPSQKLADDYGLELPLSRVVLYDTMVQHGDSGIQKLLTQTGLLEGQKEEVWLESFLGNRRKELESNPVWAKSVGRCDALLDIANRGNYDFNPPIEFVMRYPNVAPEDWPKVSFDENNDFRNPYS